MEISRALRRSALVAAAMLVCLATVVAVASYKLGRQAAEPRTDHVALVWLGPKGSALEDAIDARLKHAVAALDDPDREAAERVPAYRSQLQTAKALLRRAVLANLADTRAIHRLAAVEWELGVLDGTPDERSAATLVGVAGARAPRVPEIQIELGEILYKLGRFDNAKPFMARAVSLSAVTASRVVGIMLGAGVEPSEVLLTLPPVPEVLVALMPAYSSRGRGVEFLSVLEERIRADSSTLLATYGDLAMSLRQADRLNAHLSDLGKLDDVHAEAERQLQLGRAAVFRSEWDAAYRFGSGALALWPADPRYCEFAAATAIESNHLSEAETFLRDGLSRLAVLDGTRGWRARLYRGLGEVYERMGKGDDALVFYRRALQQDPWEPVARAKVAQIDSLLAPKDAHHP
jgi:tetratricopeptide (TPR) repeat protein